jgi:hypothetical protein
MKASSSFVIKVRLFLDLFPISVTSHIGIFFTTLLTIPILLEHTTYEQQHTFFIKSALIISQIILMNYKVHNM